MNRKNIVTESVIKKAAQGESTDLDVVLGRPRPTIGALSFPVRGEPDCVPVSDNTGLIADVVEKRQPSLLLCAGWSVPTERSLDAVITATRRIESEVVLETTLTFPTPVYFRIAGGRAFKMGEQFFSTRADTRDESGPRSLAAALTDRFFMFCKRRALLLNCGEVMVVRGRKQVAFLRSVPQALRNAVRDPAALILNPTHTRMGNCGTVKAWREYLSSGGRVYVSASNWDVVKGQHQSDTLHSFWHDGSAATPTFTYENERLCYREWEVPSYAHRVLVGQQGNPAAAD